MRRESISPIQISTRLAPFLQLCLESLSLGKQLTKTTLQGKSYIIINHHKSS